MRCGCNGPFGIQIEGGFPIEKEKEKRNKLENCHAIMITSSQRRSHHIWRKKNKKKTKIERKTSKRTEKKEKKKENKNINEKNNIEFPPNQLQPKLKA
jgi:hypothetical protein